MTVKLLNFPYTCLLAWCLPTAGKHQEIVFRKMCEFACLYGCIFFVFPYQHELTIMALSCKRSLYTRNKGYTKPVSKPVLYLRTGNFESGFPGGLLWHSTTEIHQCRSLRLLRNVYLVSLKVGMTHTYANKNE